MYLLYYLYRSFGFDKLLDFIPVQRAVIYPDLVEQSLEAVSPGISANYYIPARIASYLSRAFNAGVFNTVDICCDS